MAEMLAPVTPPRSFLSQVLWDGGLNILLPCERVMKWLLQNCNPQFLFASRNPGYTRGEKDH